MRAVPWDPMGSVMKELVVVALHSRKQAVWILELNSDVTFVAMGHGSASLKDRKAQK